MDRIENVGRMLAKNTLVWERTFSVEPKTLWRAVATKEGLSHWFMPTEFEIEEGGRFSFGGGWDGTITELDPPNRIQFTPDESDEAYLRFEIEKTAEGCLFRLTDKMGPAADPSKIFADDTPKVLVYQPGGIGTHWSGCASGYHGFVDALESHLTGNDIPFDDAGMARIYGGLMDEWHRSG